ncbi:MAG: endolytic transglycosylase MltG [Deltaproteobacteria bacterium]|nr:endolytic transglycosylase MltG [Deltaproteobacteria bacterium]
MSTIRTILIAVCLLFLLAAALTFGFGYYLVSPARPDGKEQVFLVTEGSSFRQIADDLHREGLIRGERLFLLWAKIMAYGRRVKAGEYELSPAMPPIRVLEILRRGAVVLHPVTIPEGYTRVRIARVLSEKGLADAKAFLVQTRGRDIAGRYGIAAADLEGYLFPDTYRFARGLPPAAVVDAMVDRFLQVTDPLRERIESLGMSLNEVVTLASIVEKETGRPEERPLIASVFLNRLKRRMRLESDPTVIYGIQDFNGNLTRKDLETPTPYNTYMISGLPPGPIANPGLASMKAVLYPADTKFLFFVSKNDGTHHFSRTYSEHRRAVETYQQKRRSRASKSP